MIVASIRSPLTARYPSDGQDSVDARARVVERFGERGGERHPKGGEGEYRKVRSSRFHSDQPSVVEFSLDLVPAIMRCVAFHGFLANPPIG
jgi:hypothetical protein